MPTPTKLDRLSALLAGLAPRVEVVRPATGTGHVVFEAANAQLLHLHLVVHGSVLLALDGAAPTAAHAPAIVICRSDTPHALHAAPGGRLDAVVCARAWLDGPAAPLLLAEFEQPQVVPLQDADASLGHIIQLMRDELAAPRCGMPTLLDRAGDILFIGLLRHLVAHPRQPDGLFHGLADPRIASTLVAMHAAPQKAWTLELLASTAGMSRTAFATRFRAAMRVPPGKYLGRLRLAIAQRAVESGQGLKQAARETGYGNVSALSRALSRSRANATGKRAALSA